MASLEELKKKVAGGKAANPAAELENLKSGDKPKKGQHGGRRQGSGAKLKEEVAERRGIKAWKHDFYTEDLTMEVRDPKTGKTHTVKMPRFAWLYKRTFDKAMQDMEIAYIKEVHDRHEGRAAQPIRGEGEDDAPIKIGIDIGDILRKAYGEPDTD
jgi:hypothetical protein